MAYDDEKTALEFLTRAFGFQEKARMGAGRASLMAWLAFGKSYLMIGRSGSDRHNLYSPRQTGISTAEVNVGVDDIDAHFHRAAAAGAAIGHPFRTHLSGSVTIKRSTQKATAGTS